MNLDTVLDTLVALCLIGGSLMSLGAAVGLVRFPDVLTRLHSGTKPQVFGMILLLTAVALHFRDWLLVPALFVVLLLQMLTIPIAGHMMGRSGYRNKHFPSKDLKHDDLRKLVDQLDK